MRLMEVGTKQQSLKNKEEAYKLFNQAYDLYCLFWGLNMNMLNVEDVKWVEDKTEDIKKLSAKLEKVDIEMVKEEPKANGALAKMKAFVKKAVDCCIE